MRLAVQIAILLAAPTAGALIGALAVSLVAGPLGSPIGAVLGALIGATASVPGAISQYREMAELRELARPRTPIEQQRIDLDADHRRAMRDSIRNDSAY